MSFEGTLHLVAGLFLISLSIWITIIDFKSHIIPNKLNKIIAAGGILYILIDYFMNQNTFLNPLASVLIGGGLIGILALIGSMGGGDVKYMAAACLFLTPDKSLLAIFIAFIMGGFVSVLLLLFSRLKKKSHIAFGPYLAAGVCTSFIWGNTIIQRYITWLNF